MRERERERDRVVIHSVEPLPFSFFQLLPLHVWLDFLNPNFSLVGGGGGGGVGDDDARAIQKRW